MYSDRIGYLGGFPFLTWYEIIPMLQVINIIEFETYEFNQEMERK